MAAAGERFTPTISSKDFRTFKSKALQNSWIAFEGITHMLCTALQKELHLFKRVKATCGSSNSESFEREGDNFSNWVLRFWSMKDWGPIGQPRSRIPFPGNTLFTDSAMRLLFGQKGVSTLDLGQYRTDFLGFRNKPISGPLVMRRSTALATAFTGPARVPSSKYHALMARSSIGLRCVLMISWRTREKRKGPRGSPCWVPHSELTIVALVDGGRDDGDNSLLALTKRCEECE